MKELLVVVDMQKDFVDGALGTKEAQGIVENVVKKVKKAKECGKDIIFPYKMKQGIVVRTNAIDLMEMMDFPKEITDKARIVSAR